MIKEFHPELLPQIRELNLHASRDMLSRTLTGNWLSNLKGEGIEFAGYRQYQPSDDANLIDWRASLRARKLLIKELTQDRNLSVIIMLDVSDSMCWGSDKLLKAEYAAGVANSLAYSILRSNDAVGLAMFNKELTKVLPVSTGLKHHHAISATIANGENYGGESSLVHSLKELIGAVNTRGVVVIISDFLALHEEWRQYLKVATNKFNLIGVGIRDRRDRRLPKNAGEYVVKDPSSGEELIIDCATYAEPYKEYIKREEEEIMLSFRAIKSDALFLEVGEDYVKKLMLFFDAYSRRVQG